jgi:hypothetical protein
MKTVKIQFADSEDAANFLRYKERADKQDGTVGGLYAGLVCSAIKRATIPTEGAPDINQVEMTDKEIGLCERAAKRLGYTQTAYTSSSGLWGLFCLPDHSKHRHGCFIKTKQFGIMFAADLEDLQLHDLVDEERKMQN